MRTLFTLLLHALSNQFVSGGFILMLSGSLIALCRHVPYQVGRWIKRRVIVEVDISNDDPLFAWISLWLAEHPYSQRARALTATSERDEYGRSGPSSPGDGRDKSVPQILLTPAPGNHLLIYKRRLLWLSRERKESAPSSGSEIFSFWKREVFNVRMIGRSQQVVRDLLEDARKIAVSRRCRKVEVFVGAYDYWERIDERDPRPLSSVFLPEGVSDNIVADLKTFLASQAWYMSRGIPWRRGYLFHGVPGAGKTSIICALAGQFQMNLYILNIAGTGMSDDRLSGLLAKVPMRSLVLLEDVDSVFAQRKKSKDVSNKLTFSGLLNALDGAASKEGMVLFMTTNHLDRLDDALIRPGRADYHQEFGLATAYQAESMYRAFFPDAEGVDDFGGKVVRAGMTMAEVQAHLLVNRDSAIRALNLSEAKEQAA